MSELQSEVNDASTIEQNHKLIDLTGLAIYDEAIKNWFLDQFVYAELEDINALFEESDE